MARRTIDIPDLTGETWLVTGATSGVGLETARAASAHGARVILGVRDTARGGEVAAEETRYGREIARDLVFALCGAWLVLRPRTSLSCDRALFGDKE